MRAAIGALIAVLALVSAPLLAGPEHARQLEIHDLREYFYPVYEAFYGRLAAGAPLLWNPYQLCGMPWMGTLLPGFFYPPHALYLLLPVDRAVALSSLAHLGLIAILTALLARRIGLSGAASTLAALLFTLSGTVRDWQRWPYHLEAGAWLPLGALGVVDLAGGARRRGGILVGVALGMSWLAGSPQVTVFLLYAWTGLLVALLVGRGGRGTAAAATAYAVALGAGTLLAAVALLPAADLVRLTVRQTRALSLGVMYPWGVPSPQSLLATLAVSRPAPLAIAGLVLAALAVVDRRRRALVVWALVTAGVFAALALSPLTPLFGLYRALPGLGWFRGPNRLLFVSHFCLAVAAAVGLDAVASRRRAATIVVSLLIAAALVETLLVAGPPPPVPNLGSRRAWSPALETAYRRLAQAAGADRVWTFGDRSPATLPPKLPTVVGLRSIGDYEPGALRRQSEFLTFFAQGGLDLDSPVPFEGRMFSLVPPPGRAPAASRRRLLDLAAVRFVVMPVAVQTAPAGMAFLRESRLEPLAPLVPGIRLSRNPHALPRAFVTYRTESAPAAAELLPRLADERFDPLAASYVEGDPVPGGGAEAPARGAPASIVRDEAQVVELDAELVAPGLVVLADTFHPDWVAFVDGTRAPIVATNHLFRGVPVPAGRHRVRFVYRPLSLWVGGALSALALLGLTVALIHRPS